MPTSNIASSVASVANENMQNALANIINRTVAGVDSSVQFLQEQIPDVIHQLLMWKMVYFSVCFVLGIILIVGTTLFLKWAFRKPVKKDGTPYSGRDWDGYVPTIMYDKDGDMDEGAVFLACIFAIAAYIIGFHMVNIKWLQIWIAPKVWLIEYAAALLKGHG